MPDPDTGHIRRFHEPETFSPREVHRLIEPALDREGRNVSNFTGDVKAMLTMGEHFGLDERDLRFLTHCLRAGIRIAANEEGAEVSLSDRQWRIFLSIRSRFRRYYRNPRCLIAYLKSTRGSDALDSTTASLNHN